MRIGVIGTGTVGQTLASGLLAKGCDVMLGSRSKDNANLIDWQKQTEGRGQIGTFADVSRFGDVVILAVGWDSVENAIALAGPENLSGKVLIDATNPLAFANGSLALAVGHSDSGGEQVQRLAAGARVVKCFNTVGADHMVDPRFAEGVPDMFLCGDDVEAKKTVASLCTWLGWPTIDLGGLAQSRLLEPLAAIWIMYSFNNGSSRQHAFKLLKN